MFRVAAGCSASAKVLANITNAVRNFSVKSDIPESIVEVLDWEIKTMQLMALRPSVPADFPFKIQHYVDDRTMITLSREFEGEKIRIIVRDDEFLDQNDGSESECSPTKCVVPLRVDVSKGDSGNKKSMDFVATASADEIQIHRLYAQKYRDNTCVSSSLLILLQEESDALQFGFREFLETRGIHRCITGRFLYDYMVWKSKLPHLYITGVVTVEAYMTGKMEQPNTVDSLTKLKQVIQGW